jgi:hypothetical protein
MSDEEVDPNDPWRAAWREQFKMLMRDKILQMIEAAKVTGWDCIAHTFKDPFDDDEWRLVFDDGQFYLLNLSHEDGQIIHVDPAALGIYIV